MGQKQFITWVMMSH